MNLTHFSAEAARFESALRRFDEANRGDPNVIVIDGTPQPRELVYAEWLTAWVLKLCPAASEVLRLAARCQHLCRWLIPRESYPATRAGYLRWRENLKRFHAEKTGEILCEAGYSEDLVRRVQALNLKENFPADPEARVLEDALCLVFLERQFAELAAKSADDKMIAAARKVWAKMTPGARSFAMQLDYGPREKAILDQALAGGPPP